MLPEAELLYHSSDWECAILSLQRLLGGECITYLIERSIDLFLSRC